MHLGPQNLHVGPPFHQSAGPFILFYYFTLYYFMSIRFQAGGFASRAINKAHRPAIFTNRPDRLIVSFPLGSRQEVLAPACRPAIFTMQSAGPFAILLFYYFISIRFQAGGFCISSRKTCMSARHFHQSAGPLTVLHTP